MNRLGVPGRARLGNLLVGWPTGREVITYISYLVPGRRKGKETVSRAIPSGEDTDRLLLLTLLTRPAPLATTIRP